MARKGDIVTLMKGTYKDRMGVIIAIHRNTLHDIKLLKPGERRSNPNIDAPGVVVTNCIELEDFIVSK